MKRVFLPIFFSIAVAACVALPACSSTPSYSSTLESNWHVSLPAEAGFEEVYSADSGSSFNGDGIRFHAYSYENEEPVDLMFASWTNAEGATVYYPSYGEAADAWLTEIEVPEHERPEYQSCAYCYKAQEDSSEIIFFWDDDRDKLYLVESFM